MYNFSIPADLFHGKFLINPSNCSVSVQIMELRVMCDLYDISKYFVFNLDFSVRLVSKEILNYIWLLLPFMTHWVQF